MGMILLLSIVVILFLMGVGLLIIGYKMEDVYSKKYQEKKVDIKTHIILMLPIIIIGPHLATFFVDNFIGWVTTKNIGYLVFILGEIALIIIIGGAYKIVYLIPKYNVQSGITVDMSKKGI